MRRAVSGAVVVVAIVAVVLASLLWSRHHRGGPPHEDVTLSGGTPATLYRPEGPPGAPAPVVVVGHGYSGDRATMSSFARSLAEAGYGVIAIDFRGHGANRNGFDAGDRVDDLRAAVDHVAPGGRAEALDVALLGHSMGAHAALDLAAEDDRVDATVAIGSGHRPDTSEGAAPNVLFVVAESDPRSIHDASLGYASDVAGTDVVLDRTYGRASDGSAVRVTEIDGTDHIRILWSSEAVADTVAWLDGVFGIERARPASLADPRLAPAGAYLLCVLVLVGALGSVAGRFAPAAPVDAPASGLGSLALVAAALAAAAPVPALTPSLPFLSSGFGEVISYLCAAGLLLTAVLVLRGRGRLRRLRDAWTGPAPMLWPPVAHTSLVAAGAVAVAFLLVTPLGPVFHRLVPTPERLAIAAVTGALLLPFFVPFQTILRRGRPRDGFGWSLLGHALVLVALGAGIVAGTLPEIVGLALPLLLAVFLVVEVFAAPAYARVRNSVLVGVVETLCVAGIVSVSMPVA